MAAALEANKVGLRVLARPNPNPSPRPNPDPIPRPNPDPNPNKVGLRVLTASQLELQAELTSPLPS